MSDFWQILYKHILIICHKYSNIWVIPATNLLFPQSGNFEFRVKIELWKLTVYFSFCSYLFSMACSRIFLNFRKAIWKWENVNCSLFLRDFAAFIILECAPHCLMAQGRFVICQNYGNVLHNEVADLYLNSTKYYSEDCTL